MVVRRLHGQAGIDLGLGIIPVIVRVAGVGFLPEHIVHLGFGIISAVMVMAGG